MSQVVDDHGEEMENRTSRHAGFGISVTLYVFRVSSCFVEIDPPADDDDRCWITTLKSTRDMAFTPRVSRLPLSNLFGTHIPSSYRPA